MPTLETIANSKKALRRELSSLPIIEKLRMLDALRERQLAIKAASAHSQARTPAPKQRRRRS